jgi:acylphosphatase
MWGTPTPVARLFFEECAHAYGLTLPDKQLDHLSLKLIIKGNVVGVNYRRWFKRRADKFGVTGSIENTGRKDVTALVDGPADAVSALAYLAIQGPRKTSAPSSVTATHIDRLTSAEFEIIR